MPTCENSTQTDRFRHCRERELHVLLPIPAAQRQQIKQSTSHNTCPLSSLRATCIATIEYPNHSDDVFSLDKLDVVLANGALTVECGCRINGLDYVASMTWAEKPLKNAMKRSDFRLERIYTSNKLGNVQGFLFHTTRSSASVSTPLSYILKRAAPYATLSTIHLMLEFEADKPNQLQEMLESPPDALNEYLSSVFNQIIGRRLCKLYPLVFSSEYAKRLAEITCMIPTIARSIQRVIMRASNDSVSGTQHLYATSPAVLIARANLQAIASVTRIMRPTTTTMMEDPETDMKTDLMIGFYYSIKRNLFIQKHAKVNNTTVDDEDQQVPMSYEDVADAWVVPESTTDPVDDDLYMYL